MGAPSQRRRARRKQGGGTFTGIVIGLMLGVMIALGIAWYMNRTPIPFVDRTGRGDERPGDARPAATGAAGEAGPIALPGKPGDKPVEKRRFDFYEMLPGGMEQGGAQGVQPESAPPSSPPVEKMFLQAGAFQDAAEADNLKARLALVGIEAAVQQVILPDKGTLHRVRIGPFARPGEMSRARAVLAENGIQASVVKDKDGAAN